MPVMMRGPTLYASYDEGSTLYASYVEGTYTVCQL